MKPSFLGENMKLHLFAIYVQFVGIKSRHIQICSTTTKIVSNHDGLQMLQQNSRTYPPIRIQDGNGSCRPRGKSD